MKIDIISISVEIKEISAYCKEAYNEKDGDGMSERITKLNSYLARSSELLSSAWYFLNVKRGEVSERLHKENDKLAPTKLKELMAGDLAQEESTYKLCERINRTITHQIEGLRSQLSFIKEQFKNH